MWRAVIVYLAIAAYTLGMMWYVAGCTGRPRWPLLAVSVLWPLAVVGLTVERVRRWVRDDG
jgi:hypothetical protein